MSAAISSTNCGYIRMSAPALTMVCCVTGVALTLFYGQKYFAPVFGAGCLASGYNCYLAHQFQHLKDFETNNIALRQKIQDLNAENAVFKESNERFTNQLGVFKEETAVLTGQNEQQRVQIANLGSQIELLTTHNSELRETVTSQKQENSQLKTIREDLQRQLQNLENANATLNKGLNETTAAHRQHLNRLQALNEALAKIKDTDAATFKQLIDALSSEIQNFQSQKDEMTKTADSLKTIFEQVNAWQTDETRMKLVNDLQQLHHLNTALQSQMGAAKAQLELLQKENVKLENLNRELSAKLQNLQTEIAGLRDERLELGQVRVDIGALVGRLSKSP